MNSVDPAHPVPVAIIGMGCLFPKAEGLARYWANIRDRRDAITEVPPTHWRPEDYYDADPKAPDRTYARRGGFLAPVDFPALDFGIAPHNLEATDTTQLLGLWAARAALEDAGYGQGRAFDRNRVSVILGVTGTLELVIPLGARLGHPIWRRALAASGVDAATSEEVVRRIADSYVGWQENSFPGLLGNVAAGRIANRLDLGGTNCVIDAACASSLGAMHLALLELAAGRCDLALTGGVDTFNDIFMYMCFSKTPALSPTGDARPFDAEGDGTILGEGLGILALKRLDDARRDGDRIYAVIRSVGASSDGKGQAVYAPSAAGQAQALREAYRLAGISPATVELVEAHGTGTKVGDATEVAALVEVYREAAPQGTWCALGSVKSQIGHTKAAAGAAGLIKAALALHHKVLPPTAKVSRPIEAAAPGKSPFYVNAAARPWLPRPGHPRRAAVSAFGFGGSNFHCVLEEADAAPPGIDWDGDTQIVALSADDPAALRTALDAWPQDLPWDLLRRAAARSRAGFRGEQPFRLLLVLEREGTDRARLWDGARALLKVSAGKTFAGSPDGIYFGAGRAQGRLGMLFPGQGSQYAGMLRDLACRFPAMQEALAEAEDVLGGDDDLLRTGDKPGQAPPLRCGASPRLSAPLSEWIYPLTAFSDDERAANEQVLRATQHAQPALGAVSLGVLEILGQFGVRPEAVAGHSFGELSALCAAGRIDRRALPSLAGLRGRLMAGPPGTGTGTSQTRSQSPSPEGDGGAMLAVLAPIQRVEALLRDEALDLVLANKNAPQQVVLSGPSAEIDRAAAICEAKGITSRPLPVSAAFHSRLVAAASGPFLEALRGEAFPATAVPVFSNTTALPYPDDPDEARALLAGQLARPVEFVALVDAMYQEGVRTFLEVGPDAKLTALVGAILGGREHAALAVDAARGRRGNVVDLARALAQLAALGHPVRLPLWDEGIDASDPAPRKASLTVPVCGANPAPKPQPVHVREASPPMIPPPPDRMTPRPIPETNGDRHAHPGRNGTAPDPILTRAEAHPAPAPADLHPLSSPAISSTAPQRLPSGGSALLAQALRSAQENLAALQALSERTAHLHRQFLDGQDQAQRTFQTLLEHQQRLTFAALGGTLSPPPAPPSLPPRLDATPARPMLAGPELPPSVPILPVAPLPEKPAEPRPVPAPSPTRAAAPSGLDRVQAVLLAVVAEKTGYPAEMLEPQMQLDADLGIDSIKRVEILSALQERLPGTPEIKSEHFGSLRTLGQIAEFLGDGGIETDPLPSSATSVSSRVQDVLLAVVAEKTGYPAEMLEPQMQLDADLGIDSIKRVEILSALQERLPGTPEIKSEHFGSLRTLGQIAEFLAVNPETPSRVGPAVPADRGMAGTAGPTASTPATLTVPPVSSGPPVQRFVLQSVALDETDRRDLVTLRDDGVIWITDDGTALPSALASRLDARGYQARVIRCDEDHSPPARLDGLVLMAPASGDSAVKDAFRLLRAVAPGLRRAGREEGAALVTVARLDGAFGLRDGSAEFAAEAGGLAGLAKTAGHEWPEVSCKAIDLDPALADPDEAAAAILDEMGRRGPAEVGLSRAARTTLHLVREEVGGGHLSVPLDPGDVVVITGGARGITAEVAVALAEAFRPSLVLLGRSPEPVGEPSWLEALEDEADIRRELLAREDGIATPQALGDRVHQLLAGREIRANLRRIEAAGARVLYRPVDVRDAAAVGAILDAVRAELGPIRGLIHGAGVLADRRIEDQTDEQFARVYDTKVAGLRGLLVAAGPDELKVLVVFSSTTARFGRTGQVAYAAANEVLNKRARREAGLRPSCRVVAVNWGPWDGGMVSPALKPLFAAEGIALIPPRAGALFLVEELRAASGRSVEVVVLGEGSILPVSSPRTSAQVPPSPTLSLVFERSLDVASAPILQAHVIDGRPVVPLSLMLEWLAHGAVQRNPGLALCGLDDVRVLKGVVLRDEQPEAIQVLAGKAVRRDGLFVVPVELRGTLPDGRAVAHVRGDVLLAERLPAGRPALGALDLPPYAGGPDAIYREVLFHGLDLQGIEHVEGCGPEGIAARVATAPAPASWLDRPLRQAWLTDPLALDCAFQMLILWCVDQAGAPSLPTALGRYRQFRRAFPADGVRIVARVTPAGAHRARAEIEFLDDQGMLVARIEDYECVIDASLNQAFRRNRRVAVAQG